MTTSYSSHSLGGVAGDGTERARIELGAASLVLEGDGLLVVRMKPGAHPTEADAAEAIAAQRELCPHPAPVLVDARSMRGMTRAAQNRLASAEHSRLVSSLALLVEGGVSVILANMYLFVVRPPFATQMFRGEAAARAWLAARAGAPCSV